MPGYRLSHLGLTADEAIQLIKYDDLPEDLQAIADVIGLEQTIKLSMCFAGTTVYFTRLNLKAMRKVRDKAIVEEFDGGKGLSIKALARKWGLSSRHTRAIARRG